MPLVHWASHDRKFPLAAVRALLKDRRLHLVALWTLHFHFLSAILAVNVKECGLVAKDAVHVKSLSASGTGYVAFLDFRLAFWTSGVNW